MIQSSLERTEVHRYPIWAMILVPLLAISIQTRLVLLFPLASKFDLALLITVYFASNRRNQLVGLLMGAGIGLAQDALSSGFIGVFGIVMTLIGYMGSSLGGRIDVDNPLTRFLLVFGAYYAHWGLYFILVRGLLDRPIGLLDWYSVFWALGNALLAVFLFHLLDRLRSTE